MLRGSVIPPRWARCCSVGSGANSTSCLLAPELIAIPYGIGSGRPWSPLAPDQQVVTRVSMAKALLSAGERPMEGVR